MNIPQAMKSDEYTYEMTIRGNSVLFHLLETVANANRRVPYVIVFVVNTLPVVEIARAITVLELIRRSNICRDTSLVIGIRILKHCQTNSE